jgi:hypothetical protein
MNKILFVAPIFWLFYCSPVLIKNNNNFNNEDKEYINAKLNHNLKCLTYHWTNCNKSNIYLDFYLNDYGKINKFKILNKSSLCPDIISQIDSFFNDTMHNFIGIKINKKCCFRFEFNFTECNPDPCISNENIGDIIIYDSLNKEIK